jgi:hypothetical protein
MILLIEQHFSMYNRVKFCVGRTQARALGTEANAIGYDPNIIAVRLRASR